MNRYLSSGAVLVLIGALIFMWHAQPDDAPIKQLATWQRLASPGDLSAAHSLLEEDCGACHTGVMGASRTKCIACHATDERLLIWPELAFHASVPECRDCHREHSGASARPARMDHVALATMGLGMLASGKFDDGRSTAQHLSSWIAESPVPRDGLMASQLAPAEAVLRCATCHANSDTHRGMFGTDCGACHRTSGWVIRDYRHPSNASTDCAQCHRAPPCHSTSHFAMVCATVAGKPNAAVRDCHSCHQVTAWNNIRGIGWYQSH